MLKWMTLRVIYASSASLAPVQLEDPDVGPFPFGIQIVIFT